MTRTKKARQLETEIEQYLNAKKARQLETEIGQYLGERSPHHKLKIEGSGPSTMGRCSCGTVILQKGHGTPRQQVKREHDEHVKNMERSGELDRLHGPAPITKVFGVDVFYDDKLHRVFDQRQSLGYGKRYGVTQLGYGTVYETDDLSDALAQAQTLTSKITRIDKT